MFPKHQPVGRVVVYDEDPGFPDVLRQYPLQLPALAAASRGRQRNQNVEPCSSPVLSEVEGSRTPISPPIMSTSCFEMASPSPVPPYLRVVEAVDLGEGLEEPVLAVPGNADPGVGHGKANRCLVAPLLRPRSPECEPRPVR